MTILLRELLDVSQTDGAESRVSRRARQERKKRNLIGKILMLVLGLLICVAIPMFIPSDTAQFNTQEVQAAVQQLYLDEQLDYLNPDVTLEMIEETVDEVDRLGVKETEKAYQKAQEAQEKFLAIEGLSDVYETESVVIEGEQVQDNLKLKEDITLTSIQEISNRHQLTGEDALSTQIKDLYTEATQVLEEVENVKHLVTALPQDVSGDVELTEILTQLLEVEMELERLEGQPSVATLQTNFEEKVTGVAEVLKEQAQTQEFDEEVRTMMFECEALSKNLSGSILDSRKLVSLTFDDGPNPLYTQQVLDILARYDVKATFFLLGQEVVRHPELAKQIVEEGHQVANHSFGHPNFAEISDEEVLEEVNRTQEAIIDATGITPTMYRMPYGAGGARVVNLLPDMNSVIWNVDSEDWISDDAYMIYENVMVNILPHTVVLMHDKHQSTVDSLELLIPDLLEQGYEFVDPLEVGMEFLYYD